MTTEQVLQSLIEELEEQKCVSKQLRGPFSHLRLTDELHNKTLDTAIQIIQARQSKLEEKDG